MSGTPIISKSGKYRVAPLGSHNTLCHSYYAKSLCGISPLLMKKLVVSKIWIYELFRIEPAVIETMRAPIRFFACPSFIGACIRAADDPAVIEITRAPIRFFRLPQFYRGS